MASEEQNELTEQEIELLKKLTEQQLEHVRTGESLADIQWKNFIQNTKMGRGLKRTTDSVLAFGEGLKESATAVAGSGGQFTDLSSAVSGSIEAISNLAGEIPILGGAIQGAGKVIAEASSFAFEQVQAGFSGFQELSQVGQIGAEGITGLVDDFRSAGIPLEAYTKMLQENSENLAFFSESALEGGQTFAKTMTAMAGETGRPLRRLGFTIEEIGETVVDFQKMQRQMGFRQTLTQDELQKKSMAYGKELDLIAKLTGKQREEIQKEREAAMSDARFRARIAELQAQGRDDEAIALMDFVNTLKSQSPEMARAAMDLSTGVANTEAARKAITSGMSQTLQEQMDLISTGQTSAGEALTNTATMADQMVEAGGYLHQAAKVFESGTAPFINFAEMSDVAGIAAKDVGALVEQQKKLTDAQGSQTDELVGAQMGLQNTASAMNALFLKTNLATSTISTFADVLNKTVAYIEETVLGTQKTAHQSVTRRTIDKINPLTEQGEWLGKELHKFATNVGLVKTAKMPELFTETVKETTKQTSMLEKVVNTTKESNKINEEVIPMVKEVAAPKAKKPSGPSPADQLSIIEQKHDQTKKEQAKLEAAARGGHAEFARQHAEAIKDGSLSSEEKQQGRAMLNTLHAIEQQLKTLNATSRMQERQIKELKQLTKNNV